MNLLSLNTKLTTSIIETSFQCYMLRQNLLTSHALTGCVVKMHNSPLYGPNKNLVMNYPINQDHLQSFEDCQCNVFVTSSANGQNSCQFHSVT